MKRNPKQDDSPLYDCIPQIGPCPNNCNQCYYNRPDAFYLPINQRHFPTLGEVGDGIVRVNSGHDSNIGRDFVIKSTEQYPKRFFNTSMPWFDFPDPVVFTANRCEEVEAYFPNHLEDIKQTFYKLMFIRLKVSTTNLSYVIQAAEQWGVEEVPVVLTFMRYYGSEIFKGQNPMFFCKRKHVENIYWCPTEEFMKLTLQIVRQFNSKIEMCGTPISNYCKDCLNCEKYYYQAKERMNGDTQT